MDNCKKTKCLANLKYANGVLSFDIVECTSERVLLHKANFLAKTFLFADDKYDVKTSEKKIFSFSKKIVVSEFCEKELMDKINIDTEFKIQICDFLGYTPNSLARVRAKIENENKIEELKENLIPKVNCADDLNEISQFFNFEIEKLKVKRDKIITEPSNHSKFLLNIFLSIPTFGFCWICYISKNKAKSNIKLKHKYSECIKELEKKKIKTIEHKKIELGNEEKLIKAINSENERKILELKKK